LLLPANKAKLVEVLEYHVAAGKVLSSDLKNEEKIPTLEKDGVTVTIDGKTVKINTATVTTANVLASNGVVHIIDTVLIPPRFVPPSLPAGLAEQSIPEIASETKDLSTLVAALKAADLVDTLSGAGPFTVFAPTNEAFAKLGEELLKELLLPANKAKLVEVLEYHVAAGKVLSTDLKNNEKITTLEKQDVTATIAGKTVKINTATVTTADVLASNGVVHIIDTVLIPPGFLPLSDETESLPAYLAASPTLETATIFI